MELCLHTDTTSALDQCTAQLGAYGCEPYSSSDTVHAIWQCECLCSCWLGDKYPEEAWSVSQQGPGCPGGEVIWFRFWESHGRAETVCENREWGGHFSHPRNTQGRGADVFVMDGKLAIFPWKGGTAQELRSVVASPLISVDWTFLHNWNHGRDILITEFAHNLLLGVMEDYVHRMKGIMSLFLKIVWDIKRTRQWIKHSP